MNHWNLTLTKPQKEELIRTAIICGISDQDGAYLSQFLLDKEYRVFGMSRDAQGSSFGNLNKLGVKDRAQCSTK